MTTPRTDPLADARREILVMSTSGPAARAPLGAVRPNDHVHLGRGVGYRILVPDTARTAPALSRRLGALALAGASVRTLPAVPTDALVLDRSLVVLPTDRAISSSGVLAFRLPGVVTTTVELFERLWPTATPLIEGGHDEALDQRQSRLLELLTTGHTDESAAAELGVSVRTVRRMVADIMRRLGARSRFQAGVKAADRGWLLAEAG
jgi:DNA-binding CsgD family transcriptional regulator